MIKPKALTALPECRAANKAILSQFFDVSLPTIDSWVKKGMPVVQRGSRSVPWVFDLLECAQWRFGFTPEGEDEINPETLPPTERKAWYDSEHKRRDLQERDRALIPASEVEQTIATAFSAISQGMRAIPDNLERRLGCGPETAEAVELIIEEEMNAMADRLASLSPTIEEDID